MNRGLIDSVVVLRTLVAAVGMAMGVIYIGLGIETDLDGCIGCFRVMGVAKIIP